MRGVTIITPTTGRPTLRALIESIDRQTSPMSVVHLLLWDEVRHPASDAPESYNSARRHSITLPPGTGRNGDAPGSQLRAIGLMIAKTDWVTFADDDVRWSTDHLTSLESAMAGRRWASTLRTVWSPTGSCLGIDRFESVGDDPTRRVPYEMIDNNCMVFERLLGVAASGLYRETVHYNDDRLMYQFLKQHAGPRGSTRRATIHQVCPERLTEFFRLNCSSA